MWTTMAPTVLEMKLTNDYLEQLSIIIDKALLTHPKYGAIIIELKYQDGILMNFKVKEEVNYKPKK